MKNSKRILSVSIKRMVDESPDTSWLGEYSNHASSEFSIDRAHDSDCPYFTEDPSTQAGHEMLSSIWTHIHSGDCADQSELTEDALLPEESAAIATIDELLDSFTCSCIGNNWNRREYRYFNPSFNYVDKNGKATDTPENVRKYVRQGYERMERLNAGDWCFIGIRAEAEIAIPSVPQCATVQHITSGGLYGIESDSDTPYLTSVEKDELADLKAQLLALGFSKRAIATAFKNVEHEDA